MAINATVMVTVEDDVKNVTMFYVQLKFPVSSWDKVSPQMLAHRIHVVIDQESEDAAPINGVTEVPKLLSAPVVTAKRKKPSMVFVGPAGRWNAFRMAQDAGRKVSTSMTTKELCKLLAKAN